MEAPVCKLCGQKHWLGASHVFTKTARAADAKRREVAAGERLTKAARKDRARIRAADRSAKAKGKA
jgi:hypothetical protein